MILALLLLGLVAGWLAARYTSLPASAPSMLNSYILNAALPATILLNVPLLTINSTALVPVVSAWSVILGSALLVYVLSRVLRWSAAVTGALLLVVPLSNSAYLGLPLLDALRGSEAMAYGALYDQLGNFLALAVYAPIVVSLYGNSGQPKTIKKILFSVFSFVPFPVLLVALFVMTPDTLPDVLRMPLTLLSKTMAPMASFIVGFSLRFLLPQALLPPFFIALGIRLLLAPALVFMVTRALGLSDAVQYGSVLQAAMPCMITAGLVGIAAGFSERLIVALIAYSTLIGLITVLLINHLLG